MPSPVGHLIAGASIAWMGEALYSKSAAGPASGARPRPTPLVVACAALALAPDLDILFTAHRTVTHSLGAVVVTALASAAIARALKAPALATGALAGIAVASHVLLDWLGRDSNTPRGVMALWPVTTAYFYSGLDVFAEVSRRYWKPDEFILGNAISVMREVAILGPLAAVAFWLRSRRRTTSP